MIDPKTFKVQLELTVEEANTVLAGLQELPAKLCNPLSQKIQQQAVSQLPQDDQKSAE